MTDMGGQAIPDEVDLEAVAARGRDLALPGSFEMPPGDPVSHFGAGFVKTMASNIFLTGLDPAFAAENTGFFTAPRQDRHHVVDYHVDHDTLSVTARLDNDVTRIARMHQSQGAIAIPQNRTAVAFEPSTVSALPDAQSGALAWSEEAVDVIDAGYDPGALAEVAELGFATGMTAALLVTHHGRIILERYREGIGTRTPLESWSMGKSIVATLVGRLIEQGEYELDQPAPIPSWQEPGDPRAKIRIRDILNMSSGLRFRAMQDPDYNPSLGYPDHLYIYNGGIDAFDFAASRPQQWAPATVGRYRNCDPALGSYLVRLAVEKRGEQYHEFPQRALFDPLGVRDMTLETDPFGNFQTQGYEFGSARDWARLGNLYLNDGVCNGKRLLPEGWADFVSTIAPAWRDDGRPIYGGFFWINGMGQLPIPRDAYFMGGAGFQRTIVIPSHDLVVVRLGHYGGADTAPFSIQRSLARLMEVVPPSS